MKINYVLSMLNFANSGIYTWKYPQRSHTNGTRIKEIKAGYTSLGAVV